ncbi:hypothetical protein ACOMHN_007751 [Nucella lapillus]
MAANSKTGPLKNLTEQQTINLIEYFQSHEAVWDPRAVSYRNRNIPAGAWTTIRVSFESSIGIVCTDEQVQAKCDSLRSSFTRELRKVKNSKKSGAGTDEVYVSSWCFYQQLQFLRAVIQIMKPRSTNMVSV